MNSILEALAKDEILPASRKVKQTPQLQQAMERLLAAENALRKEMKPEEKALLDEMVTAQIAVSALMEIDTFVYAYRLGARITTEVFMA